MNRRQFLQGAAATTVAPLVLPGEQERFLLRNLGPTPSMQTTPPSEIAVSEYPEPGKFYRLRAQAKDTRFPVSDLEQLKFLLEYGA